MKVVLCEDIEKLGYYGDIVDVKTGYARNCLLPQGLARIVSSGAIKAMAKEKAKRAEHRLKEVKRLEAAAKAVEGAEAVLAAKANEQGHLYGSITAEQVAKNLREQGFEVANEIVVLHEHIKQLGTYSVELKYKEGVIANVKVVVVAEQQQGQDTAEA